jgi:TRAP-type transport system periplasmic protein
MSTAAKLGKNTPIELVIHNVHEHGVQIMDMWVKEVETRTRGRVTFKKTSGEDRAAIQASDLVRDVPAAGDRYPLLNLVQIPFIIPSSIIGSKVIAQLYAEFAELRNELSDNKVVGLSIGSILAIFSSQKWGPIRKAEDFKGARTRSLPMVDGALVALGAKPLHMGWFDMPRLLGTGELDALVLGVLPAHQFKLADGLAPYCTLAGKNSFTMHPMRVYMKWESWNKLPPDIQKIIDEIGPAGGDSWYAVNSGRDSDMHLEEALDYIRKKGELIELSPQEFERWQKLIRPLGEKQVADVEAKGLPARKFFARMKELVTKHS